METQNEIQEDSNYTKLMKVLLTIYFFLIGLINHLETILILTGSRVLAYELNLSTWMHIYTPASTISNKLTLFINSRYLVHISYKKRITFYVFGFVQVI